MSSTFNLRSSVSLIISSQLVATTFLFVQPRMRTRITQRKTGSQKSQLLMFARWLLPSPFESVQFLPSGQRFVTSGPLNFELPR